MRSRMTRRRFLNSSMLALAGALTTSCSTTNQTLLRERNGGLDFSDFGTSNHYPYVQRVTPNSARLFWYSDDGGKLKKIHLDLTGLKQGENSVFVCHAEKKIYTPRTGRDLIIPVMSDSHAPYVVSDVINQIASEKGDLIIHNGDVVDDGDEFTHWQSFLQQTKEISGFGIFPSIGNHSRNSHNWYNFFDLPGLERTYTHSVSDLFFTHLDSNEYKRSVRGQFLGLQDEIKASEAKFKILVMHHPMQSIASAKRQKYSERIKNELLDLIDDAGFSLVLTGHDHVYQKSHLGRNRDITHVVNSPTGKSARAPIDGSYVEFSRQGYGYGVLNYTDGELHYTAKDNEGNVVDRVKIAKR